MGFRRSAMNVGRDAAIAGAALAALAAAGCGDQNTTTGADAPDSSAAGSGGADSSGSPDPVPAATSTDFRAPGEADGGSGGGTAITYDEAAVPAGAAVTVLAEPHGDATTVTLDVSGLAPDRDFGVHAHTRACGPDPSDSGPHYQNDPDPAATPDSPSTDPAYANPDNEVWLDITTDGQGAAHATTTVDWLFRPDSAHAMVLHDRHTRTAPGEAGTAGDRLACVDVDF